MCLLTNACPFKELRSSANSELIRGNLQKHVDVLAEWINV